MKILYGVFVLFFVRIHDSVRSQKLTAISEITPKLVKYPGDTAYLTCTVFNPLKFNISWVKVNKEPYSKPVTLSVGKTMLINDTRFFLRQDIISTKYFDSNCYTLQISNVRETDAGVYSCHVMVQSNDTISADTEIDVHTPPTIFNLTRTFIVRSGHALTVECYARGNPMPNVIWKRQGGAILVTGESVHRGNVLEFVSIRKADRGLYYCGAENGVGKTVHRTVYVVVEFEPYVSSPKSFCGQVVPGFIDLECHIEAYPTASIYWMHNGIELFSNEYHVITNNASSDAVIDSKLSIHLVQKKQLGDYFCKASNALGTDEVLINIHESVKPRSSHL